MQYIILDLEWNNAPCAERMLVRPVPLTGEIIQIGAVKMNEQLEITDTFKVYVRPRYYTKLKARISELTGITADQLKTGLPFPKAFRQLIDWCGEDSALLTWSNTDIQMLDDNLRYYDMARPAGQPAFDLQLIYSAQNPEVEEGMQPSLHSAVEFYGIEEDLAAHDALNDAYYTAYVCQKLDLAKGLAEYQSLLPIWMRHLPASSKVLGIFPHKKAALEDKKVSAVCCPVCGKPLGQPMWVPYGEKRELARVECAEHGWLIYRLAFHNLGKRGCWVRRECYRSDAELDAYYDERRIKWEARVEAFRRRRRGGASEEVAAAE